MADKKPKRRTATSSSVDQTVQSELSALWRATDGEKAFIAALEDRGYLVPAGESGGAIGLPQLQAPCRERYEAFRLYKRSQRRYRLGLRPVSHAWQRVAYLHLMGIGEDKMVGKMLTLMFSTSLAVVIRGRNLRPIADAIDLEICEFIQEYDPTQWPMPDDMTAPFIEAIEFYHPKDAPRIALTRPAS